MWAKALLTFLLIDASVSFGEESENILLDSFDRYKTNTSFVVNFSVDPPLYPNNENEGGKIPKIVGGEDAYIEDVPYQVSLRILNETSGIWR